MVSSFLQIPVETAGETLNNSVGQLTESSIKLAEAAANFGALKLMFGVFIVFVLIMMLFYLYQMLAYNKKIGDIHISTKKVEKYFEESASRSLGKSQASIIIRRAFNSLAQNIKYTILRTRLENKLDPANRDAIQVKISRLMGYEYSEFESFLANFDCEDRTLSEIMNPDDVQIIVEFMMEQIFLPKDTYTISNMDKETDVLLNGIKLELLKHLN